MKSGIALAILAPFAAAAAAAAAHSAVSLPTAAGPIGPEAVWQPTSDFVRTFHKACDAVAPPEFGECFVAQMQKAGASPAAQDFARRTGSQGYLRAFRETGRVDVAYADYPFRANQNRVCLLVNGEPPMIDVDDLSRLEKDALASDSEYAKIAKRYPKVAIFPADRFSLSYPKVVRTEGTRIQRFLVGYSLRDGCHACAVVGSLRIAFVFDVNGKFVGTQVLRARSKATE